MEPIIIFENNDIVVVNKPAGLLVHEDGFDDTQATLVAWLLARYPEMKGVGEPGLSPQGKPLERSGVVHRLDRDTSGVVVCAKNQEAHAFLKQQFHDRLVYKEYRAFVYGRVHDRWGTIDRPIGRSAKDFRLRSAQRGARGIMRPATTDYERIGAGEYEGESFSYVKLIPKTGRTHQLRVHLKAIDRPIVGDTQYAPAHVERSNNLALNRLALHAHILEFVIPGGESERFMAPVPADFEAAAERIAE
jgi:23S rRNA pseudouridine1911/1915/1917 synthase